MQVDRACLPRPKVQPLTLEEIALRRDQVRQKYSQMTLEPNQEKFEKEEPEVAQTKLEEEGPVFIGFARVFSGSLKKGQEIFVLGPKYHPSQKKDDINISLTLEVFHRI